MNVVKVCPLCGRRFSTQDILHDQGVTPLGIQLEEDDPRLNFFFFTHDIPNCGTTFVIPVEAFAGCLQVSPPVQILAGTEPCEGHCLELADHGFCRQDCRFAPYRRLLVQMLQERQINPTPELDKFSV